MSRRPDPTPEPVEELQRAVAYMRSVGFHHLDHVVQADTIHAGHTADMIAETKPLRPRGWRDASRGGRGAARCPLGGADEAVPVHAPGGVEGVPHELKEGGPVPRGRGS